MFKHWYMENMVKNTYAILSGDSGVVFHSGIGAPAFQIGQIKQKLHKLTEKRRNNKNKSTH